MKKRVSLTERIKKQEKIRKSNLNKRKKKEGYFKRDYYPVDDFLVRGIYFLYKGKNIVYIGMSKENVMERICAHANPTGKYYKDFDSFSFEKHEDKSDKQLRSIESSLIFKYKPKENKVGKNRKDKSVDVQLGMSTV